MTERAAPPPSDPEQGIWRGRSVARRFVSPEGLTVLVGRSAADNDLLTFGLGGSDMLNSSDAIPSGGLASQRRFRMLPTRCLPSMSTPN